MKLIGRVSSPIFHGVLIYLLAALAMDRAIGATLPLNRVLHLDGDGDYVQLPNDIVQGLEQATVEAWIQWESFGYHSQPWGLGSARTRENIVLNNADQTTTLQFFIYEGWKLQRIHVPTILKRGQWHHIAAVYGQAGMSLYLNGVRVGQHEYRGTLSANSQMEDNYLGKPHWPVNAYYHGQLDEVRIWNVARTKDEIRECMFERLTGSEDHLVGLWNFDKGDGTDSTSHRKDGIFYGDAHCVEADLPLVNELVRPSMLSGRICNDNGVPLQDASVVLEQDAGEVVATTTDSAGRYRLVFYPSPTPYDLMATWKDNGDWRLQFLIAPGELCEMDLTLQPAVSVTGTLMAYDNSLHAGASVQAIRATEGGKYRITSIKSDENGQYRFINLKPGKMSGSVLCGKQIPVFQTECRRRSNTNGWRCPRDQAWPLAFRCRFPLRSIQERRMANLHLPGRFGQ